MFGTLCFLFCNPIRLSTLKSDFKKRWFFYILVNGIAYGTIMEFVQKYWIPNRSFELNDIVADSCGCLLGVGFCWWMMNKEDVKE